MKFGWDEKKAEENLEAHDVTFDEAQEVFFDRNAIDFFDSEHSTPEEALQRYRTFIAPTPFCCLYRIARQNDLANLCEKSRSQVPETI